MSLGLSLSLTGGGAPSVDAITAMFAAGAEGGWYKSAGLTAPIWTDSSGNNQDLAQDTAAAQPTVQAAGNGLNEALFDGTADYLMQAHVGTATFVDAVTLPDGYGSHAGKGFTCTGLCRDPLDGTFWVANHGKGKASDPSYVSSIVNLSADRTTIIREFRLDADMGIAGATSVQGIAVNTVTNKVAFFHLGDLKIYEVDRDGTGCTANNTIGALTGANALTWDSVLDQYVTAVGAAAKWYNRSTGALVKTVNLAAAPDQVHYDAARNWLFYSYGANGSPGMIGAADLNAVSITGEPEPVLITCTEAVAAEGIVVEGDTIYFASDEYYHGSGLNRIIRFSHAIPTYIRVNQRFQVAFVVRVPTAPASSACLFSLGNPLAAGTDDGFGLFTAGASLTALRLFHKNGFKDFTANPTLATTRVLVLDCDITNNLFSLWIGGTLIQANIGFASPLTPTTQRKRLYIGTRTPNSGTASDRFLGCEIGEIVWVQGTGITDNRAAIEAVLTSRGY